MSSCSGKIRQEQRNDYAAGCCAYKTCFHPIFAVFIHGAQKKKCVKGEPVAMVCLAEYGIGKTYKKDHTHPQSKSCLKRIQTDNIFHLAQGLLTVRHIPLFYIFLPVFKLPQYDQQRPDQILERTVKLSLFFFNLGE